ncbi:DUF5722 domain-containing protein [Blastopirellula sp. J2-11]|uniref:DUF5722 domain-containing protein n=1 Tax=Blastopirellula sp. J2-11 TaxID=2943192 RepID=UPI0021C7AB1D|nr:DUF5722 domain-containing protein [Blastopirellula sp. J2-11]UUO07258.1 DUF5722 domain-containing protein [Blastopirellula sp. J2-11]
MTWLRIAIFVVALVLFPQNAVLAQHPLTDAKDLRWINYLAAEYPAQIERVVVDADHVQVIGKLTTKLALSLSLVELGPQHDSTLIPADGRRFPLQPTEAGNFSIQLPRFAAQRDRIYAKWVVVETATDKQCSRAHAADDVAAAARHPDLPRLFPANKKGLNGIGLVHDLNDFVDLGVKNLAINVNLGSLVRLAGTPDCESIEYGDVRLAIWRPALEQLDELLGFASRHEIVASAIILVPRLDRADPLGKLLTHPGADGGHYSLANVVEEEGCDAYAAVMRFLAARYCRPDAKYGRITHWIIHNEVDAAPEWTSAGPLSPLGYAEQYARSLRIAYYSARAFDPHAQVFASLTHCWNEPHQPSPRYYRARELLDLLIGLGAAEGDFSWGVAFHPYPQDLGNARTWLDAQAIASDDSPLVTFKNIEVLDRWVRRPENRSQGAPRTVLLSEQGFHSPDYSAASQAVQAAALAYAWKKIERLETIEAMHYHRWIDHEKEGGLKLGLWTVRAGTITSAGEKKQAWRVFQALATPQQAAAIQFALPIIGIDDWSEIVSAASSTENSGSGE